MPVDDMAVHEDTSPQDRSDNEDAEDFNDNDNESMFDMFTGEAKELQQTQEPANTDYALSEASWDGIEEYEHTRYDVELRKFGQDFVLVTDQKRPAGTIKPEQPKDVRTLNASATQPYEWKPLPDSQTIRLLDLLPAKHPGDLLQAQMKLSDRANYRAVSYAHHVPTEEAQQRSLTIPCDGQLLQVSASLYYYLSDIRTHLDRGQWTECQLRPCIWVDAVCLNPNDAAEQEQRASKTADVFRNAQGTIICLQDAVGLGEDLALRKTAEALITGGLDVEDQPDGDDCSGDEDGELLFSKADMEAFLQHTWFSQHWRIQEFALQKRRTVLVRQSAIPFPALFAVIQHYGLAASAGFASDSARMDSFRPARWLLANLWRFRHTISPDLADSLRSLLNVSCGCRTGQAKSWCGTRRCAAKELGRLIDGTRPIEKVLTELAKFLVEHDAVAVLAVANVLRTSARATTGAVINAATGGRDTFLPSWVPDWRILANGLLATDEDSVTYLDRCFCEDDHWYPGSSFDFHEELETWRTPEAPGVMLHEAVGALKICSSRELAVQGWILERPKPGTKLADVDWFKHTHLRGVSGGAKGVKPGLEWKSERVKHLKERGERIRVMAGDWPKLDDADVLLFMPGRQVMFVLKPAGGGCYSLASMIRRNIAVDKPQFVFTDRSAGMVWAYGDFARHAVKLWLV